MHVTLHVIPMHFVVYKLYLKNVMQKVCVGILNKTSLKEINNIAN